MTIVFQAGWTQGPVRIPREVIAAADEAGDQATADLATRRVDVHEKNAWMLSSHLE